MKPRSVRSRLFSALGLVAENFSDYVTNPEKDFSRMRCISFRDVLAFPLSQGPLSSSKELPCFYSSGHVPSASAFRQQREKVSFAAFQQVFRSFTDSCLRSSPSSALFRSYHLLAVDGSRIVSAPNPFDSDSAVSSQNQYLAPTVSQNEHHLNALFSLSYGVYCDAVIQSYRNMNECRALCDMISRSPISKAILLADRNYESYNVFAHLQEKGWRYLIRVKDSSRGIASGLVLPDLDEFVLPLHLSLSRKKTHDAKALYLQRNAYTPLSPRSPFDFPFDPNGFYTLHFSVVRVKISDHFYETFITNLDLSLNELKLLYAMRWGIETSFRHLKYTVGLLNFHSKKEKLLLQEIFAALILYNFSRFVASGVTIPKKKRKYDYIINFSRAVNLCRKLLLKQETSPRIECLLLRDLTPIRTNRMFPRKLHPVGFVSFNYR